MRCRFSITAFAISAGLLLSNAPLLAETSSTNKYKVLASENIGMNLGTVESYIKKGDQYFLKGDYGKARKEFDKARNMSKQLLGFYRDLSSSFKGLDARIPREMDSNGREALASLAKSNLRLASLFRKKNQPEVAVPLLIEVVRILTPAKPDGQKAYQALVELGFANTPYGGARKNIY